MPVPQMSTRKHVEDDEEKDNNKMILDVLIQNNKLVYLLAFLSIFIKKIRYLGSFATSFLRKFLMFMFFKHEIFNVFFVKRKIVWFYFKFQFQRLIPSS